MPILSIENTIAHREQLNRDPTVMRLANHRGFSADRATALELHRIIRDNLGRGQQMHKGARPWDLMPNFFDNLDRTEAWYGWEFETGWATQAAYRAAVEHTYDAYNGVMYDSEGEGRHAVEITFPPQEASKYRDGTADACQFMDWVQANNNLTFNGGNNNVGTHLNISDPRFTDRALVDRCCRFLNRTLELTSRRAEDKRKKLFGRATVYGGFYHNISNNGTNQWLEFKGFRTTYSRDQFGDYVKTAEAIRKAVDLFFRDPDACNEMGVKNLYSVAFLRQRPTLERWTPEYVGRANPPLYSRRAGGDRAGTRV